MNGGRLALVGEVPSLCAVDSELNTPALASADPRLALLVRVSALGVVVAAVVAVGELKLASELALVIWLSALETLYHPPL